MREPTAYTLRCGPIEAVAVVCAVFFFSCFLFCVSVVGCQLFGNWLCTSPPNSLTMKLNFANPVNGAQKTIDIEDEGILCVSFPLFFVVNCSMQRLLTCLWALV